MNNPIIGKVEEIEAPSDASDDNNDTSEINWFNSWGIYVILALSIVYGVGVLGFVFYFVFNKKVIKNNK